MEERGTAAELPMRPQVVTWNLAQLLSEDAIICGDSGTITTWAARMRLRGRQRFSFSGTHCSMAAALPYAIGAQTAYPGRQVVALTGDGSLSMMLGDLVTLCQHQLPVKVIVLKNNTLGLIKWEQMVYLGYPEYGVDLAPIDFVKVAEACGARGIRIEEPQRCKDQLEAALVLDGPVVVEAVVDQNVPPLPPKITRDQAQHLAQSLARGEVSRKPISLTIGREMAAERDFSASPFGLAGRVRKKIRGKISEKLGRDGGEA
jgi:pyruvate dehydrogenase (quinone)/pyruvate oxidase